MPYTLTVKEKHQETPTITSLLFDKPEGFTHKAGQFLKWVFPSPPDERGNSRSFSIASSPTEDHLLLTTRIGPSAVKQWIHTQAAIGSEIKILGPLGRFILDDTDLPLAFLVGGVGITPLRSMIKYLLDTKSTRPITLIYSNTTQDEICYHEELASWAASHSQFTLVNTLTRVEPGDTQWHGKTGRINEELIKEYVKDLYNTQYYTSGPPTMVEATVVVLQRLAVPSQHIHSEIFTGY